MSEPAVPQVYPKRPRCAGSMGNRGDGERPGDGGEGQRRNKVMPDDHPEPLSQEPEGL